MAIIKSSVVGKLKGRSGQFNFRTVKGKNIMSLRPPNGVKVSQTPQAKRARKDFALAVKFSKEVNSIPELKAIWNQAKINATNSYQKLMKINSEAVKNTSATTSNKITPDGLSLNLSYFSIDNNELNLEFIIPSQSNIKFPAAAFILLYFNNFNKSVFMIRSEIAEASPDKSYQKNIPLIKDITDALMVEPHPIIYLAVAGVPANKRKIYWTITEARKL